MAACASRGSAGGLLAVEGVGSGGRRSLLLPNSCSQRQERVTDEPSRRSSALSNPAVNRRQSSMLKPIGWRRDLASSKVKACYGWMGWVQALSFVRKSSSKSVKVVVGRTPCELSHCRRASRTKILAQKSVVATAYLGLGQHPRRSSAAQRPCYRRAATTEQKSGSRRSAPIVAYPV